MLDWWFDIEGRICCARMDERKSTPDISFDGDVKMRFDEVKLLRSGLTYAFTSPDGHRVFINDVRFRGERFVSLYLDRILIKEYNVRAERYKEIYYRHPEWYDFPKKFFAKTAAHCLAGALFAAIFGIAVAACFGAFDRLAQIFAGLGICFLLLWPASTALVYFLYDRTHGKMEQYAIVSSITRKRKKRVRKRVRRR